MDHRSTELNISCIIFSNYLCSFCQWIRSSVPSVTWPAPRWRLSRSTSGFATVTSVPSHVTSVTKGRLSKQLPRYHLTNTQVLIILCQALCAMTCKVCLFINLVLKVAKSSLNYFRLPLITYMWNLWRITNKYVYIYIHFFDRFKNQRDLQKHTEVHNEGTVYHCTVEGCDYSCHTFQTMSHHFKRVHEVRQHQHKQLSVAV